MIVKSTSSPVSKTKNTWSINLLSQISTKPIHRARCTIIKQHLEHQNTLYAQFARQVLLMKVISNKKIPQPQKDYGIRYNSLQSLQRHQCLNRSLDLQRITLSQSLLFGNSAENLHSRRINRGSRKVNFLSFGTSYYLSDIVRINT